MLNFTGGTGIMGTSMTPLGVYAGYLLMHSGNIWLAACFLGLALLSFLLVACTVCRYIINYRRTRYSFEYTLAKTPSSGGVLHT